MYVDFSLLATAAIAFLTGIAVAMISERGSFKEIVLTVSAGIAFTAATYSLIRVALLLVSRSGPCFYATPWEVSQCYIDLLTMSGISGISGALGAYLLGLALRGDKQEPQASKARGSGQAPEHQG